MPVFFATADVPGDATLAQGAVHWIDGDWSRSGGSPAEWAARSLSLPIDQRLGSAEIDRIAAGA